MSYVDDDEYSECSNGCYEDESENSESSSIDLRRLHQRGEEYSAESVDEPEKLVETEQLVDSRSGDESSESEELVEEAPIKRRGRGKAKGTKLSHNRYVLEKIDGDEAEEMGRYPTIQAIADALGFPYHKAYGIWRGQNRSLCKKYIISKLD